MRNYTKDYNDFLTEGRMGPEDVFVVFDDRQRLEGVFYELEDACMFFGERWNGREGWVLTTMKVDTAKEYINPDGMAELNNAGYVLMMDGDFMERRGKLSVPFGR